MTIEADTRETLLTAVNSIAETLAAEWLAEEAAATLSAASVEALTTAGIFAMKLPRALGPQIGRPQWLSPISTATPDISEC